MLADDVELVGECVEVAYNAFDFLREFGMLLL
jgi:hypothetical protein